MHFDTLLVRQDGVFTHAQALRCGFSRRTISRRVACRQWFRLHPRVYLAGGHRLSVEARIRAAWLWIGDAATVSGSAAAYWHRMTGGAPTIIQLTVPAHRPRVSGAGVRVRRRDLAAADRVRHRDLWVTGRALTVLEAAAALDDGAVFLDRALQRFVPFHEVYRAYCRMLGSTGAARAGELLVAAADRAASAAERKAVRLLRDAGLTGWVLGHPFGPWKIDIAFVSQRIAIEVDGWAWHTDPERFANDRRKGNALTTAGWVVLRFTWHDLVDAPARVVAQVRAALAAAAHAS